MHFFYFIAWYIYFVTLWYCMVLHCMIWYLFCILCYLFCILLRFSLHPPIWLSPPIRLIWIIWLSRPIRINPPFSFGSSGSSSSIHPSGLLFVICHLSFVIWYFLFVICLFVICCIVVYCIAWYIFCYLMALHGIALYDLVSYIIYFACFCVFRFVARAVSRKTPIPFVMVEGGLKRF